MNVQRFQAPTLRDALAKARQAFGEGTLILANRSVADGYEVVATAEQSLAEATRAGSADAAPARPERSAGTARAGGAASGTVAGSRRQIEHDTERLAMSTLSFQEYVRERMMAKRVAEQREREAERDALQQEMREVTRSGAPSPAAPPASGPSVMHAAVAADGGSEPGPSLALSQRGAAGAGTAPDAVQPTAPAATPPLPGADAQQLLQRLETMQQRIEHRLDTVAWLGQARYSEIHTGLLLKLLRAGYSPAYARQLVQGVPAELQPAEAVRAAAQAIAAQLLTDTDTNANTAIAAGSAPTQPAGIVEAGGRFALIGPAGWGKTSAVMKLVAAAVQQHGAGGVGLITLDAQRAGAPDALRQAARSVGTVAHVAHDRAALLEMLSLLERKALVLIDTAGHAPRDPALRETLEMATWSGITQLLVVNAAAQAETIDATLAAFATPQLGGALLTRMDEAVKLGPVVDALVRHQVRLRGLCTGPRVNEDWQRADAFELVKLSLRTPVRSVYDPQAEDLALHFAGDDAPARHKILEG